MDDARSKCKECVTTNNPTDEPSWWITDDKPDMVNNPQHYQSENGLEVIDVIEAFTAELKGIDAVCTANAIRISWQSSMNICPLQIRLSRNICWRSLPMDVTRQLYI